MEGILLSPKVSGDNRINSFHLITLAEPFFIKVRDVEEEDDEGIIMSSSGLYIN